MILTQATRNQAYFTQVTHTIATNKLFSDLLIFGIPRISFVNCQMIIQKIKVMFVRYISHEMRTPLNTAAMGLQYLRSEMIKADTNLVLVDILDEVRGACEISVTILNEMLDFDKLQTGLMKLEVEEIPVKDFLITVISPFHVYVSIALTYSIIYQYDIYTTFRLVKKIFN